MDESTQGVTEIRVSTSVKSKLCSGLFSVQQHCSPSVSGAQLQLSVERPCPREIVTLTCTISSVAHRWRVSVFDITRSLVPGDEGEVISDPPFQFNVTEVVIGSYIISTATVSATANLNGTLVVCQDGNQILADQSNTINIIGEYSLLYLHANV